MCAPFFVLIDTGPFCMMTSWHGDDFGITGPFSSQRTTTLSPHNEQQLWSFFYVFLFGNLNKILNAIMWQYCTDNVLSQLPYRHWIKLWYHQNKTWYNRTTWVLYCVQWTIDKPGHNYRQISNTRRTKSQTCMFLVSSCSCLLQYIEAKC